MPARKSEEPGVFGVARRAELVRRKDALTHGGYTGSAIVAEALRNAPAGLGRIGVGIWSVLIYADKG